MSLKHVHNAKMNCSPIFSPLVSGVKMLPDGTAIPLCRHSQLGPTTASGLNTLPAGLIRQVAEQSVRLLENSPGGYAPFETSHHALRLLQAAAHACKVIACVPYIYRQGVTTLPITCFARRTRFCLHP